MTTKTKRIPCNEVARLVMGAMAARPLRDDEEVRPINGDETDCRPENLEMWCEGECIGQPVLWLVEHAKWIIAMYDRDDRCCCGRE